MRGPLFRLLVAWTLPLAVAVITPTARAAHGYRVGATLAPTAGVMASQARGSFSGTLKEGKLLWTLLYFDLSGPPTFTRIEIGASGKGGGASVRLCIHCRNSRSGATRIGPMLLAAILQHRAYVTVHTTKHASGEIRGLLVVKNRRFRSLH